jgi:hypothetical protein
VRDPDAAYTFDVINLSGAAAAIPMNLGITESYDFEFTGIASGANLPRAVAAGGARSPTASRSTTAAIRTGPDALRGAARSGRGIAGSAPPADPAGRSPAAVADPNPFSTGRARFACARPAQTLTLVVSSRKVHARGNLGEAARPARTDRTTTAG